MPACVHRHTQTHACMQTDESQCALPVIVCGTRREREGFRGRQRETGRDRDIEFLMMLWG